MEARGIGPEKLTEGVKHGSMDLMGEWTLAADQVLVF
jgi:sulfur relay (sulfurtransferase) complex TusBCD TusD component (DsrE family)